MRTWLITGGSGGFGNALAREALAQGDRVMVTVREAGRCDDLLRIDPLRVWVGVLDLAREDTIDPFMDMALRHWGGVDVLVNNAGIGIYGAVEEVEPDLLHRIFQINVFSPYRMIQRVLPGMRARRAGRILTISSIAGLSGGPGRGLYSASKFAIEGLSESLSKEVGPLGIHVITAQPGPYRTSFGTNHVIKVGGQIADYNETAGKHITAQAQRAGKQPGDPVKAAKLMYEALTCEKPPSKLILGAYAIERYRRKVQRIEQEIALWQDRSEATSFD